MEKTHRNPQWYHLIRLDLGTERAPLTMMVELRGFVILSTILLRVGAWIFPKWNCF